MSRLFTIATTAAVQATFAVAMAFQAMMVGVRWWACHRIVVVVSWMLLVRLLAHCSGVYLPSYRGDGMEGGGNMCYSLTQVRLVSSPTAASANSGLSEDQARDCHA